MDDETVQGAQTGTGQPAGETVTPGSDTPPTQQTEVETTPAGAVPQTPATPATPARSIPYERFREVNDELRQLKREMAQKKGMEQYSQYDPNDLEALMAHPLVQDLLIKQAKHELRSYAQDLIGQEPYASKLHAQVKRAILDNARGFVNENTRDIESAKLDLLTWVERVLEDEEVNAAQQPATPQVPQAKQFPVAATNAGVSEPGQMPREIAKILEKPVTTWSAEETKLLEEYSKGIPKK